jgi:hypothetical protein
LTTGESVEYIAVAGKASLTHTPDCLVLTNKRIMLLRKKVLGKYDLDDCQWRDVREASTKEGKNGIALTVQAIQGWRITSDGLPRAQAWRIMEIAAERNDRVRESLPAQQIALAAAAAGAIAVPGTPAIAPGSWLSSTAQSAGQAVASGPAPAGPSSATAAGAPVVPAAPSVTPSPATPNENPSAGRPDASAVAPATLASAQPGYVPTPESVLQTILQQSQAAQDGAPTRPMQFAAAAFQAPAPVEAQPVTFRDTDTEPNMRPIPPMPTLEQIAVFSGPLAFNHQYAGESGSSLKESSSGGRWAADDEQLSIDNNDLAAGGPEPAKEQAPPASSLDFIYSEPAVLNSGPMLNPSPAPTSSHSVQITSSGGFEVGGDALTTVDAATDHAARENVSAQSESMDLPFDVADLMGFMMPSAHDLAGGPLPMPGTLSSGPLLPASQFGLTDTRGLSQPSATDTGTLSTQRLYYDSSSDDAESDRPTDINLGHYPVPMSKSSRNGKVAGPASSKSQSSRSSGTSGGRSSSKQSADDPISKMKQLKTLLDAGFITESDYEAKKADILARFF